MPGFLSNMIVNGTNGADTLFGSDPAGNTNDIVYGHQGDDSIFGQFGYSNSTIFGGQGNDTITQHNISNAIPTGHNAIYGNLGNDVIYSIKAEGDSIYGGQGDDQLFATMSSGDNIYGNQGNDVIEGNTDTQTKFFGGQGNDTITDRFNSDHDAIYGNQGNDLLMGEHGVTNSHEYGGQGDDTLVFTGSFGGSTTNDVETGGFGNDLFIATNDAVGGSLETDPNDIVTVTDFLQGFDKLSETSVANIPLLKVAGTGDNAVQALLTADNLYEAQFIANPPGMREYIFVYGGIGAGFLFYNGDASLPFSTAGMAITGATSETSVNLTDITASKFA
jgi:Ca2+-binding RTX toxin-like protein